MPTPPPSAHPQEKEIKENIFIVLKVTQKLGMIWCLGRGESQSKLICEFGTGSAVVYDVKLQKADLIRFSFSSETGKATEKCFNCLLLLCMTKQRSAKLMGLLDNLTTCISCEWQTTNPILRIVMAALLKRQDVTKELLQQLKCVQLSFETFFSLWSSWSSTALYCFASHYDVK